MKLKQLRKFKAKLVRKFNLHTQTEHEKLPEEMDEKKLDALDKVRSQLFEMFDISDSEPEGDNATTVMGNDGAPDNADNATDNAAA